MIKNKSDLKPRRYTNADIMVAVESIKTDLSGVKADLSDVKADLSGVKTDLSGVKTDLSSVKADAIKTKNELVSLIVDVRNDLKQDIHLLDQKIDGVKTELEEKIETNSDDIIGVIQNFVGMADSRFHNYERRLVKLER